MEHVRIDYFSNLSIYLRKITAIYALKPGIYRLDPIANLVVRLNVRLIWKNDRPRAINHFRMGYRVVT